MTAYATIEGFESLTKQQLFDMSLAHIRSTGVKSTSEFDEACIYGGTGCAAACFLRPDKREEMDNVCHGPTWSKLAHKGFVPDHEREFVHDLQRCHDNTSDVDVVSTDFMKEYERNMECLAEAYSLLYTPPKQ